MRSRLLWCLLLFVVAGFSSPAWAGPPACTINTSGGVAFGNYDPTLTTAVSVIATPLFTCTYTTGGGFNADFMASTGSSGTFTNRTMTFGTQTLKYNLYVNTADSIVWGDGTGGTEYFVGCYGTAGCAYGSGTTYQSTVYAVLPAGQDVSAGIYTDTLTLTLTF